MLKAGVAIRNLTPLVKTRLCGYPDPPGRSGLMARDPLYGSAYYFENKGTRALFFTCDLISLTRDRANELRMVIEKHTGIPRQNVCVCCTHTHSGPMTGGEGWGDFDKLGEVEPENNDRIRDLLLEAAIEASTNTFDAVLGWGSGTCGKEKGVGGNRHDPENGPCDPSVGVVAIKDKAGELRGCMVNYSLHPTVLHDHNFFYPADFPGYIRKYLNNLYPFMVFGFQMGSSGDQSTRFFRTAQNYDEAKRIGVAIAEEAEKALANLHWDDDPVIACASEPAYLPLKTFPSHEEAKKNLDELRARYKALVDAGAPYSECRAVESVMEGAIFVEGFTASLAGPNAAAVLAREVPVECYALRLGGCVLAGIGTENFVAVSQAIKEASPFELTLICSLANGNTLGYVCTDEAYDRVCYEAQESTFSKGAAGVLIEACGKAVTTVSKA